MTKSEYIQRMILSEAADLLESTDLAKRTLRKQNDHGCSYCAVGAIVQVARKYMLSWDSTEDISLAFARFELWKNYNIEAVTSFNDRKRTMKKHMVRVLRRAADRIR